MSSRKFGIAEVRNLVAESHQFNLPSPEMVTTPALAEQTESTGGKKLMAAFAPLLDQTEWVPPGACPSVSKKFESAKKLAACYAMLNRLKGGVGRLANEYRIVQESTTAAVDLPTFVRQLLMTITRAYARMFALELYGVIPLQAPYARINFKDYLYDSNYVATTPTVAGGTDRIDDITKFNPNYYLAPEGVQANRQKFKYSTVQVTAKDYRVISEWTDSLADDAMAVYEDDAEQSLMDQMAQEMARVVDRQMVAATLQWATSSYSWTAAPVASPNYATLSPSEQAYYDERLFRDGLNNIVAKIRTQRKYNNDGDPDWAIIGTTAAIDLMKLRGFKSFDSNQELSGATGALRDLGTLDAYPIRFMVDPMLQSTYQFVTGNTNGDKLMVLGRKPSGRNDVGLKFCPYVNLQPTRDLYDPETGITTKGVRSRFGIAQPDGINAAATQLGDIYGILTIA